MKIIYDRIDVVIPVGEKNFNKYITLREGNCIGAVYVPYGTVDPAFGINIGVEQQNSDVISSTHFKDWFHKGGGALQGLKPCSFKTRGQANVYVVSDENIAVNDFKGQLIFAIDIDECNKQ